jgi:hypothetical protein
MLWVAPRNAALEFKRKGPERSGPFFFGASSFSMAGLDPAIPGKKF